MADLSRLLNKLLRLRTPNTKYSKIKKSKPYTTMYNIENPINIEEMGPQYHPASAPKTTQINPNHIPSEYTYGVLTKSITMKNQVVTQPSLTSNNIINKNIKKKIHHGQMIQQARKSH